ncbi:COX assembly mitochondrial protein homolog [Diadema antillarum]|uniref:COX assembly mitochondrial protein homolog n=1 Tax=Diadema antillarum TaxID=105358 RepID=UPI003A8537A3
MAAEQQKGRRGFAWQEDDDYLRKVEYEVLIPKKMREKAKVRCAEQVNAFTECCKLNGLGMVVKCREENNAMKQCITKHYQDQEFFDMCKKEYLQERSEFRKTGVRMKDKPKAAVQGEVGQS